MAEDEEPQSDPESQENIRFQNELERLKMQAEFGAHFVSGEGDLPPEIEAEWLKNIRDFERAHEDYHPQKIRDILGNPTCRPLAELNGNEVSDELDKILELMASRNLALDYDQEVPDEEIYRFITEELMDHETEVNDLQGWVTHLIYEEFHPNHVKDILHQCEGFCRNLFEQDAEYLDHYLDREMVFASGAVMSDKEFIEKAKVWFDAWRSFSVVNLAYMKPVFDLDQEMGHVNIFLDYNATLEDGTVVNFAGPGIFYLHLVFGLWMICGMDWPGFKEWAGV